ncbi:MAG: hypothetical protein LUC30_06130 [Clostridiales bacterium]|nr:hypothetical protein [Clostridiales bacterium]
MSEQKTERENGWTLFRETGLPQAYTYWKLRQRQREAHSCTSPQRPSSCGK